MKVLAVIQDFSKNSPFSGFIFDWMITLSKKVDRLIILTLKQTSVVNLPFNVKVYSLGKEKYSGFWRKFYYMWQWHVKMKEILKKEKINIIFTHMAPIYSVLAYPYVITKKIPIVTWFLHPSPSFVLKVAYFCSTKIVSAAIGSYPYKGGKLVTINHGINTHLFNSDEETVSDPNLILSVGRLSSIKDYSTILKALSITNRPLKLVIIGDLLNKRDKNYQKKLLNEIHFLNLEKKVKFVPAISMDNLAGWYKKCSILINATPHGSLDKVVLEAMACRRLVLVVSSNFKETLGDYWGNLSFKYKDHYDLKNKILFALNLLPEEKDQITSCLQKRVVEKYNLDSLMERLTEVFRNL